MKLLRFVIVFITCNICLCRAYCQQKNKIGLSFQLERVSSNLIEINSFGASKTSQSKISLVPALTYERKITRKSSVEIELKYRYGIISNIVLPPTENQTFMNYFSEHPYSIKESFISVPILYKFNSSIINFSVGPTIEYLLKKEQVNVDPPYIRHLGDEYFTKKWSWGLLTSISKSIPIYKKLLLEPSLYYNPIISFKRTYVGIGIAAKYKF